MCAKTPYGISRFHNTPQIGGGPEGKGHDAVGEGNNTNEFKGAYAQVTSATEGVSFKIPLSILPGDLQTGNIITMTIQRNPVLEQKRHSDILSIQQQFLSDPYLYNNA